MVACWTILKLSQVAPTAHTSTPLRLAMLEAAGSCQRHCSCLNSLMFWCTRDVDSAALVQLTRKYDKRKQESSGQLIDQDDDDAKGGGDAHACGHVGPVQRPPAGQNFSKTLLQVYGPLSPPCHWSALVVFGCISRMLQCRVLLSRSPLCAALARKK